MNIMSFLFNLLVRFCGSGLFSSFFFLVIAFAVIILIPYIIRKVIDYV